MRLPNFVVITARLFAMAAAGQCAYAQDEPHTIFRLCQGDVEYVEMQSEREATRVHVQLTADAARSFAALTEMRVGSPLLVTAGEATVSKSIIRARIDSGILVSKPLAEDAARQLIHMIKTELPESPCGIAQQGAPSTAQLFKPSPRLHIQAAAPYA